MENLIAQIQMTTLSIVVAVFLFGHFVLRWPKWMDYLFNYAVVVAIPTGFIATLVRIWVY